MEKPFHHPSGVLLVAQPLAFRQRENAQSPRELGKQELGAAASWNPGKGTAPQPRLLG